MLFDFSEWLSLVDRYAAAFQVPDHERKSFIDNLKEYAFSSSYPVPIFISDGKNHRMVDINLDFHDPKNVAELLVDYVKYGRNTMDLVFGILILMSCQEDGMKGIYIDEEGFLVKSLDSCVVQEKFSLG